MKTDYDVIIVGAGPAGASCAKHLVKNGVKTLVIEKKKLPRYKCCGGFLSNRSIKYVSKYFGNIPQSVICNNKYINLKISFNGNIFFRIPGFKWLNINRSNFDYWLIENSKVDVSENSIFLSQKRDCDIIIVNFRNNNKIFKLKTKYLIGADGGNSNVRKSIDNSYKTNKLIFFKQIVYEGKININKGYLYYIINKNYSDFLSWIFMKDDYIYIGTSYYIKNKKENFYNILLNMLNKKYLNYLKLIRIETCLTDVRPINKRLYSGKDNILLSGESSGLMTIIGEGISSALITGKYAADSILETINKSGNVNKIYYNKILKKEKYTKNIIRTISNF